jgi:cell division septation protein DedD
MASAILDSCNVKRASPVVELGLFFASRAPIVDVQAKDRLTGAVILVALVVLVVPEILSGPEHGAAAATDQTASAPQMRSYSVDLGDIHRAPEHSAGSADAASSGPTATATAPAEAGAVPAEQGELTESPPQALPPPAAPPATEKPAPHVAAVRPPPAAAKPAVHAAPTVVAAAKPAPAASAGHGAWTVQLGTFSNAANAERLVHELQGKGFAAFSAESSGSGRKLYRVRVGPASDHSAAMALAERLRSAGHPGSLTEHP